MIHLFKKKKNFLKLKFTRGFTLIETFVAISIIMVAIVGPLLIVSRALSSSYYARDQIIAFYLAQDAVEFIRNKRDENKLNYINDSNKWLDGLEVCKNVNGCHIDTQKETFHQGVSPVLKFNKVSGIYGYDDTGDTSFIDTFFKRTIKIKTFSSGDEAIISVDISWRTGILDRSFNIKENIFNWQWQGQ